MNARGMEPEDAFVAGRGPLANALRALPRFEPPARMAADFQAMLAGQASRVPAFEPPATLEAAVLGEIARQQAAQADRRQALLDELARGVDPEAALDAELSPAARAWLAERARGAAAGERRAIDGDDGTRRHRADAPGHAPRGRWRWPRLPAPWWRYAGGGLAAVLALGIGLRMMLEPESAQAPTGAVVDRADFAPYSPAQETAQAQGAAQAQHREALASRERIDRERAMRERSPRAAAAPPPPARTDRLPPAASAPPPAAAPGPAPAPASAPQVDRTMYWRLADDPAARLRELGADGRWVLRSHPSEREAARRWLQRGLDAHEAVGPGASDTAMLRDRLRIESSDEVPAGELRLARDD